MSSLRNGGAFSLPRLGDVYRTAVTRLGVVLSPPGVLGKVIFSEGNTGCVLCGTAAEDDAVDVG